MKMLAIKRLVLVALVGLFPFGAAADQQFSLGLGMPYGSFLGGKYSLSWDRLKIYAGAGFLGKSHDSSAKFGYNLGFEYVIVGSKHSLGAAYGTVTHSSVFDALFGPSISYTYYFSGFDNRSWLLGLSVYSGKDEAYYRRFKYRETEEGFRVIAGFQF